MHNKVINLALVSEVAQGLKELKDKMVFIGGAVISLYTDDPAADEIRPTSDIDMTINLANYAEWTKMQERLSELEFYPDPHGQSICSYKFQKISIDIMPADDSSIGISNTWYKPGFKYLQQTELPDGIVINILPTPYFLATKIEAFKDRGQNDFYGSHDFEDIIYLIDNRTTIVEEIHNADETVKHYVINELQTIKNHPQADEILAMHIHPLIREERFKILKGKLDLITNNRSVTMEISKNSIAKDYSFSDLDTHCLCEAIRYFRAREGNFSSEDPLVHLLAKLTNQASGKYSFTGDQIQLLLKVLTENIGFIENYDGYKSLPNEQSVILRHQILEPLYRLRKTLTNK